MIVSLLVRGGAAIASGTRLSGTFGVCMKTSLSRMRAEPCLIIRFPARSWRSVLLPAVGRVALEWGTGARLCLPPLAPTRRTLSPGNTLRLRFSSAARASSLWKKESPSMFTAGSDIACEKESAISPLQPPTHFPSRTLPAAPVPPLLSFPRRSFPTPPSRDAARTAPGLHRHRDMRQARLQLLRH